MKNKCLIWGTGDEFKNNIQLIKYYEMLGMIEVIGLTSNEEYYDFIMTYKFIAKDNIEKYDYDYLIIAASGKVLESILNEVVTMAIDERVAIPIKALKLPAFDFDKYIKLKEKVPTIFTPHCWGGVTYNALGLPFKSPFINMYEDHDDFLKLLKNPKYYMERELEFVEMKYESILKRAFPIARCGDILLYFNHYKEFDEAKACWERRKKRIDWDNIFVEFYDENEDRVKEFLSLPYENKICFVPFSMKHKNVIPIEYKEMCPEMPFWRIVMSTAGYGVGIDVLELLLNHEIITLSKYR